MAHPNGKSEDESSNSIKEDSDSGLEESNSPPCENSTNENKSVDHDQKAQLSITSASNKSSSNESDDDKDSKEKSNAPLKTLDPGDLKVSNKHSHKEGVKQKKSVNHKEKAKLSTTSCSSKSSSNESDDKDSENKSYNPPKPHGTVNSEISITNSHKKGANKKKPSNHDQKSQFSKTSCSTESSSNESDDKDSRNKSNKPCISHNTGDSEISDKNSNKEEVEKKKSINLEEKSRLSKNSCSSESSTNESEDKDSKNCSYKTIKPQGTENSKVSDKQSHKKKANQKKSVKNYQKSLLSKTSYSNELSCSSSDDKEFKKSYKSSKKHNKDQSARFSKTLNSSESSSNESDEKLSRKKSYKQPKTHYTENSYQFPNPKNNKKSNKRDRMKYKSSFNENKYYHQPNSDSNETNDDVSNIYNHKSYKLLKHSKQENSPINSKSLINSLSFCPKFSESLLNLAENEDILPKYVRKIVNDNPHLFSLCDNIVTLSPKIYICEEYLDNGCPKRNNCYDLHICQGFMINACTDKKCILSHNITSKHNYKALRYFKIHKLSTEMLFDILKTQICPNKPLKICNKYNSGICKNPRCDSLHICLILVQNNYKCKLRNCKLNHDLLDARCLELLAASGVPTNEAPRDVLAALLEINPSLCEELSENSDPDKSKENSVHKKKSNQTKINSLNNDVPSSSSVTITKPSTNLGSKAVVHHDLVDIADSEYETSNDLLDSDSESVDLSYSEFELSFQWQVSSDGNQWVNMYHSQMLRTEQAYCDPNNESISLSKLICPNLKSSRTDIDFLMGKHFWEANFQSMLLLKDDHTEILYLRRQNVDLKPQQNHEIIIFLWYFEDSDGKWLECSQDNDRKDQILISVSSSKIEKVYLKDPNVPFTLGNSYISYILDFDSMTLLNLQNNKNINVRRRPKPHLKNVTATNLTEINTTNKNNSQHFGNNNQNASRSQRYTVWTHNPEGYVEIPEICYDSVENICKNELNGCKRLHAKVHFHWQVSEDGTQWLNMHPSHVLTLERAFCNPENDDMPLPRLDLVSLGNEESGFLIALGTDIWRANFQSMLLLNKTQTSILYLRRLTTESIAGQCIEANSYIWYVRNTNDKWSKLEKDAIDNFSIDASSAAIEGNFQQDSSSSMNLGNSSWTLRFNAMILSNNETDIQFDVKRRPKPHMKVLENDNNLNEREEVLDETCTSPHSISAVSLPDTWDAMLPGDKSCRITLSQISTEFATVQDILPDSLQTKITNIERIQNPFLWYAFQNKISEMSAAYENDESKVNVMQLFHGTKPDVIGNICTDNFDWRLHGSHAGQVYGRGTYFSSDATISYRYSTKEPSGKLYLLLARVAVGTITLGDSTLVRPPINNETGIPYDSTVNNLNKPTIIVKYDKQEYVPEYIITIE